VSDTPLGATLLALLAACYALVWAVTFLLALGRYQSGLALGAFAVTAVVFCVAYGLRVGSRVARWLAALGTTLSVCWRATLVAAGATSNASNAVAGLALLALLWYERGYYAARHERLPNSPR